MIAAFQKRVLLTALRLLERDDGPVLIEDFPDDDPRARPDPAWRPPLPEPEADGPPQSGAAPRTRDRVAAAGACALAGAARLQHDRAQRLFARRGGRYIAGWLRGEAPASPREGYSAPLLLRFAIDDLKAYYLEAASGTGGKPSSRQLGDWFWNGTAAGAGLHALRAMYQGSDDDRLKLIAGNFMVPAARQNQPA